LGVAGAIAVAPNHEQTPRFRSSIPTTAYAASSLAPSLVSSSAPALRASFVPNGPAPIIHYKDDQSVVAGAVHTVVVDPDHPNVVWIGAVNGGVWKTRNFFGGDVTTDPALPPEPTWVPLTDHMGSLAIGALALDPTDSTHDTLLAGIGKVSSVGRSYEAPLVGLLSTKDGGASWTSLGADVFGDAEITGVAPRGVNIVVTAEKNLATGLGEGGVWFSPDGGTTINHMSGQAVMAPGSTLAALPDGSATSLVGDPANPDRLYAAIMGPDGGVFRSDDAGLTWIETWTTSVRTDTGYTDDAVRIMLSAQSYAGGTIPAVYGALVDNTGNVTKVFRSLDAGQTWIVYDAPPAETAAQNKIAITGDPTSPDIFYVAGDEGGTFRCQVSPIDPTARSCDTIIHGGTANGSAAKGDSRMLAFDGDNALLQVDDGGIYWRTTPRDIGAPGVWFSRNGDLAVAETYACDYDGNAHVGVCGTQDNGVVMPAESGDLVWDHILGGDGAVVSVSPAPAEHCPTTSTPCTIRYYSHQQFKEFTVALCDTQNVCATTERPLRIDEPGSSVDGMSLRCDAPFECIDSNVTTRTPMAANRFDAKRLVIATKDVVYESTNHGLTVTRLAGFIGFATRSLVYGGVVDGVDNPDLIYAGSQPGLFGGPGTLFMRSHAGDSFTATGYPSTGGSPFRLVVDPNDARSVWLTTTKAQVWHGTSVGTAGEHWDNVTVDLSIGSPSSSAGRTLESIALIPSGSRSIIAVGADDGIYVSDTDKLGHWSKLVGELPDAIVPDLIYNDADDVLFIATVGRSTWLMQNARELALPPVVDASPSATTGDFHDETTLSARLTDGNTAAPIAGAVLHFALGAQHCTGTTDASGVAACTLVILQDPATVDLTASFAGDGTHTSAYDTLTFVVRREETTTTYLGPTTILAGSPVTLRARLTEDATAPLAGRSLTLGLGAQHCVATTGPGGVASCSLTYAGMLGPVPLVAQFAGDTDYRPSVANASAIVFAFPAAGATFAVGDGTVASTTTVTWWGAHWSTQNALSGGAAPASFKGFAASVSLPPASCGGPWVTAPSASPPTSVPPYMGVVVTSSATKSSNTVSGSAASIVVVRTDPGYTGAPSAPGTGTIVATYCP
jgi:hypothetical protein